MSGYQQTIDNLVYYGIKTLQSPNDDHWRTLDSIAKQCAETYDIPYENILKEYTIELRKQLLKLVYNV